MSETSVSDIFQNHHIINYNILYISNTTKEWVITIKNLDRILEFHVDLQWHTIEEIKNITSMPKEKLTEVLFFMQEQSLINITDDRVQITPKGLRFLELPLVTGKNNLSDFIHDT